MGIWRAGGAVEVDHPSEELDESEKERFTGTLSRQRAEKIGGFYEMYGRYPNFDGLPSSAWIAYFGILIDTLTSDDWNFSKYEEKFFTKEIINNFGALQDFSNFLKETVRLNNLGNPPLLLKFYRDIVIEFIIPGIVQDLINEHQLDPAMEAMITEPLYRMGYPHPGPLGCDDEVCKTNRLFEYAFKISDIEDLTNRLSGVPTCSMFMRRYSVPRPETEVRESIKTMRDGDVRIDFFNLSKFMVVKQLGSDYEDILGEAPVGGGAVGGGAVLPPPIAGGDAAGGR
jgi:hypothetical protein